ncbi:MAG TPA: ABC transporter substrate-binding protein [Gammaproteobacteria bacterium]|nr:ABC transporter substrate-binding protein [Gammaproteobacteria bacterium]
MNKNIILLLISLMFSSFPVLADVESSTRPDQMLEARTNEVLTELSKNGGALRNDLEGLYQMVDRLIMPMVDFTAMSKLILGKHWKKASPEQREAFIKAFSGMLKNTYTKSLRQYANQSIRYLPAKTRITGKYATVYSEFVPGNGKPNVPVIYKLRQSKDGTWKAYNLELEGLSVVKNFRTDFNREISATSLDALIARLEKQKDQAAKTATN